MDQMILSSPILLRSQSDELRQAIDMSGVVQQRTRWIRAPGSLISMMWVGRLVEWYGFDASDCTLLDCSCWPVQRAEGRGQRADASKYEKASFR
jgi:hypothetical protein